MKRYNPIIMRYLALLIMLPVLVASLVILQRATHPHPASTPIAVAATATIVPTATPLPPRPIFELHTACNGACTYYPQQLMAIGYPNGSYHPVCAAGIIILHDNGIITCPKATTLPGLYVGEPIGFCFDATCNAVDHEPLSVVSWSSADQKEKVMR